MHVIIIINIFVSDGTHQEAFVHVVIVLAAGAGPHISGCFLFNVKSNGKKIFSLLAILSHLYQGWTGLKRVERNWRTPRRPRRTRLHGPSETPSDMTDTRESPFLLLFLSEHCSRLVFPIYTIFEKYLLAPVLL